MKARAEDAAQRVVETVPIMDGAERLISTLRRLGYKIVLWRDAAGQVHALRPAGADLRLGSYDTGEGLWR